MQELRQAKEQYTYNHHNMVHTPVGSVASFTDSLGAPLGQTNHSHQPGLIQGFRTSSQPDARQRTSAQARSAVKRLSTDPPYGFDDQEKRARLPSWPSDSLNPFNTADEAAAIVRATRPERPPSPRVPQLAFSSSSPDLTDLSTTGLGLDPPTPWHPPPISSTLGDVNAMAPTINLGIKPLNITPQATESPPNDLSNHLPSTSGTQQNRTGSLSTPHQQSQPPMQPVPFGKSPSLLQVKSPLTGLLQQAPLLCNRSNTNLVPQRTSSTQQQLHTNQSGSDDTAHSQGPAKAHTTAAASTANTTPMATPTFKLTSPGVENTCAYCKATSTSGCWRRGWELPPTPGSPPRFANLCNKCGLRHKHGRLGVPAYTKLPKTLPTRSDTSNVSMAMGRMPPRTQMTFTGGFNNPISMTSNLPVPVPQCASQLTRTPTPPTPSTMPAPNPSFVNGMGWVAGHEHGMVLQTRASRQSEGGVASGAGLTPLDARGSPAGGGTSGDSSPDVYESPGEGTLREGMRMGEEAHGHARTPWDEGPQKSAGCELVPLSSAGAGMMVYEAHHDAGGDSDQGGTGTVLMRGALASMSGGGAAASWPDTSDGMATWLQPAPSMNPYQLPGDVMMMVMSADGAVTNTTANNGGTPRFTTSSHIGPDTPQTQPNTYMTATWTTPAITLHLANDNGDGHISDGTDHGNECAGLAVYAPLSTANHHLMPDPKCALLGQQQAVCPVSPHNLKHHLMAVTTGVPPFRTASMSMAAAALLAFKSGGNVDGGEIVGVEHEGVPNAPAPPLNVVDSTGRAPAPGPIPSEPAPEQQDPTANTQVATNQQTQASMVPPPAPGPPPGPSPSVPAAGVGSDMCIRQSNTQEPPAPDPFKDPAAPQQQQQQANCRQLRGFKVHLGMSKVKVNPPWGWTRQQLTAWLESISCQVLSTQLDEQQVDSTALIVLAAMAPDMATLHNILAQEFQGSPLGARLRLAAGIMHFKSQLPPSRTLQGMMA